MSEGRHGRVITFYSYKGGTGRSMALANLACVLAQRNGGKRVLALDWDLEAPGLHRYFEGYVRHAIGNQSNTDFNNVPGLTEILSLLKDRIARIEQPLERDQLFSTISEIDWASHIVGTDLPALDFIKAGRFDTSYQERINTFDWVGLHARQPQIFGALADYLADRYDYVLIDSRTGLTDISGICTALLPDTVVAVFTPNRQSISGVLDILRQAAKYRLQSDDLRPLRIFPLASRIEVNEKKLQEAWRFGDDKEQVSGYQTEFEDLFRELYNLDSCDMKAYFNEAQVQYVPYYSFGERIAVLSEVDSNLSLARTYTTFAEILSAPQNSWETTVVREPAIALSEERPWDEKWYVAQSKQAAAKGLNAGPKPFMQVCCSLPYQEIDKSRVELLRAAESAEDSSGWPLGIIFGEKGPRPSADGIGAEVERETYNYWSLRNNGDCYLFRTLDENRYPYEQVYFDFRIADVVKSILYCKRLYESLGLSPRTTMKIAFVHSGFASRELTTRESRYQGVLVSAKQFVAAMDTSSEIIQVTLEQVDGKLASLAKQALAPMFELFDFASIPDVVYEDVVARMRANR